MRSRKRKSFRPEAVHYDEYRMSFYEVLKYLLPFTALLLLVSYVFFDSLLPAALAGIPLAFLFLRHQKKSLAEKRKESLKQQFLSAATLLGDDLRSGWSVENAILRSEGELQALYGEGSDILREWRQMGTKMSLNQTAEEVFGDFGVRSGIDQIRDFSEIFAIVKRGGGQLGDAVSSVSALLSEQFLTEDQIRTVIAQRKLELRIMDLIPIGILLYIRFASPDLLALMYETMAGRLVMTASLAVYIFAVYIAERIIRIRF